MVNQSLNKVINIVFFVFILFKWLKYDLWIAKWFENCISYWKKYVEPTLRKKAKPVQWIKSYDTVRTDTLTGRWF